MSNGCNDFKETRTSYNFGHASPLSNVMWRITLVMHHITFVTVTLNVTFNLILPVSLNRYFLSKHKLHTAEITLLPWRRDVTWHWRERDCNRYRYRKRDRVGKLIVTSSVTSQLRLPWPYQGMDTVDTHHHIHYYYLYWKSNKDQLKSPFRVSQARTKNY